jgi:hypothetical protein
LIAPSRFAEHVGAAVVLTDRAACAASRSAIVWAIHGELALAGVAVWAGVVPALAWTKSAAWSVLESEVTA